MADFPKKQQQCLIPKYLLDYTTELNKNHPDPTDPWGGSGGDVNIEAGTGITITTESDDTKVISLDTNPDVFEVTADTGMTLEVTNTNPLWMDAKLQMAYTGATRLEGTLIDLYASNGMYFHSDYAPYYVNNTTHEYKTLATTDQLFSGNYNDLTNKPTIPDPVSGTNDGTNWTSLTIGEDTYGLASGGGTTYTAGNGIDITGNTISIDTSVVAEVSDIPTNVSDLNNDAGYITGINSSDVTTALGYTPYNSSNPDGYITGITSSDVITALGYTPGTSNFSGSYNDLTDKPTIPTKTSDLTNDSNYIPSSTSNDKVYSIYNLTPFGGYYDRISYESAGIYYESNNGSTSLIFDHEGTNNVSIGIPNVGGTMALTSDIITSYNDLTDKPTIPTVNNSTITIQKNGTTVDSFTLNQSTNKSINISVPTDTNDLTNGAGYITGITSSDVTTALGYTPGTSNFSGDYTDLTNKPDLSIYAQSANLATVATSGSYNDLTNKPTIPDTTYMVTTNTTQEITGEKTFKGDKRIKFKGTANGSKLGFTGYDQNGVEVGYLEMCKQDTTLGNANSNVLGYYSSTTSTGPTPSKDPLLGFKYQTKDSTGTNRQLNLMVPTRATASSSTKYIPISVNGNTADNTGNISLTIPTTATSTVTPSTATVVNGVTYTPATETLVFTYTDNTTATITILTSSTSVTSTTATVMTGATVTTTLS